MANNMSGCFFLKHGVYCIVILLEVDAPLEATRHKRVLQTFSAVGLSSIGMSIDVKSRDRDSNHQHREETKMFRSSNCRDVTIRFIPESETFSRRSKFLTIEYNSLTRILSWLAFFCHGCSIAET